MPNGLSKSNYGSVWAQRLIGFDKVSWLMWAKSLTEQNKLSEGVLDLVYQELRKKSVGGRPPKHYIQVDCARCGSKLAIPNGSDSKTTNNTNTKEVLKNEQN